MAPPPTVDYYVSKKNIFLVDGSSTLYAPMDACVSSLSYCPMEAINPDGQYSAQMYKIKTIYSETDEYIYAEMLSFADGWSGTVIDMDTVELQGVIYKRQIPSVYLDITGQWQDWWLRPSIMNEGSEEFDEFANSLAELGSWEAGAVCIDAIPIYQFIESMKSPDFEYKELVDKYEFNLPDDSDELIFIYAAEDVGFQPPYDNNKLGILINPAYYVGVKQNKPTTTEGKIEYIYNAYKDIKSAIEEKGGSVGSDISEYAEGIRNIKVSEGVGLRVVDENGLLTYPSEVHLPSNVANVDRFGLCYAFNRCNSLYLADLSSLKKISGDYALYYTFQYCQNLTSIDFSNLTIIDGNYVFQGAFNSCSNLTSIDFSNLTTINGSDAFNSAFNFSSNLTSIDFSNLTVVGARAFCMPFYQCSNLEHVYFRKLNPSSFGEYKNQFSSMFSYTSASVVHKVHFPSNMQSTISKLDEYPLFGGTSGYVELLFDLPATGGAGEPTPPIRDL